MGKSILIATNGSLGDLHPYITIGLELSKRGYLVNIASNQVHQTRVEAQGFKFFPLRPHLEALGEPIEVIMHQIMNPQKGGEYVLRQLVLPSIKETYADLIQASQNADLLLSHSLMLAAPLVAEKMNLPWVSSTLAPISLASIYDPSVTSLDVPQALLQPGVVRCLVQSIRWQTKAWMKPLQQFRRELGLAPGNHPLFEGQHSPHLALALFSETFSQPQIDWPTQVQTTGFMFSDGLETVGLSSEILDFLKSGSAPIVFTLGTAAIFNPGNFFLEGIAAVKKLGYRAIFVAGGHQHQLSQCSHDPDILVCDYAPFSQLFLQAQILVHQGGIGTTAEALRSGVPMLIVPHAHDQPDNAVRTKRLGVARVLAREKYTTQQLVHELQQLLTDPGYRIRADLISRQIQQENGVGTACDAIENLLNGLNSNYSR
jgi:rhamnosyltransferase subunit B